MDKLPALLIVAVVCVAANPEDIAGAQDIDEPRRLRKEGEQAFFSRDYAKSEALFRRLLAIQEKTIGFEHNDTVRTIFFIGASLEGQGRPAEAHALQGRSASAGMLAAINVGNADRALDLLEQGANPNVHDPRGRTALMYAGSAGQTKVLRRLLESGADVHAKMREEGTTALMAAVNFGDPEAIRLLLSKGADANAQNTKGETALALAHQRLSNAPTDRRVFGRKLPEKTQFGDLSMATKKELKEIIKLLKKAGARN
jgi:ankyrin repeat protein